MRRLTLTACLALALPYAARAQGLPPAVAAFAAEQSQVCAGRGGTPRVGPAFATAVDLNGDGALDYIVDLAGIECANAWSAFCGAAGCPVSVWIAGPQGHAQDWGDFAQGWTVDGAGGAVALVVEQQGDACPGAASDAGTCSQRLAFDAPPPAPAAEAEIAAATSPAAASEAVAPVAPAAPAEALDPPGVAGWTLRASPDGPPVAVSDGPGAVTTVAVFCLAEQPWLAVSLREPPAAETAQVEFAFSDRSVLSTARREDSAGGALIVELADRPLAALLAGRDTSAVVSVDGAEQGVLSLRGSTRAIRGALETCMAP